MFRKIEDDCVMSYWRCTECGDRYPVNPDWYQENGTPVCIDCNLDMQYLHTEVFI